MDPVLSVVLSSWDWRPEVIAVLVVAGSLYGRGWWRLHSRSQRPGLPAGRGNAQLPRPLATGWRLAAYLGGLSVIGVALMSPIAALDDQLFFVHMFQHELLITVAPPLLLLANPMPFSMWGLPDRARRALGRLLAPRSAVRRGLQRLTAPGIVWMAFTGFLVGWHDPGAYNATLRSELLHDLEHITFFGSAMLFWWHVIDAAPHWRPRSHGFRLGYVFSALPANTVIGVIIAFANQPTYTYYDTVPRLWGLTVLEDQMIAGVIMWILGGLAYLLAALILISHWVRLEDDKPPLPEAAWETDELIAAPEGEV